MIAEEFLDRQIGEQRRHLRRRRPHHQEGEKAISARVTAPIATIRAAPSDFTKSKKPCTGFPSRWARVFAPHPARFAQFIVSVGLTR